MGSSPHTRGAPGKILLNVGKSRIIPAYAGSTRRDPRRRHPATDHPRIRGEHFTPLTQQQTVRGSSPHTRGALARLSRILEIQGIIPAYAGST